MSTSKVITPSQPSEKKVTGVSTQSSNNTPLAQRKKLVPGSFASPSQSSNRKLSEATPSQSSNKTLNGATPSRSSNKKLNGVTPSQSSNKKLSGKMSSQSSNKTLNGAALQKSVNSPVLENKRVVPTPLHMSLNLNSPNSTASTNTMRKSLFMEKMGDKDIVKRAFKAFQNSFSQGSSAGDMTHDVQDQVHHSNVFVLNEFFCLLIYLVLEVFFFMYNSLMFQYVFSCCLLFVWLGDVKGI